MFSVREVLAIHSAVIARFGGAEGLRDKALLESALAQPFQTFGGDDLYPSLVDKACRYAFGVIKNHPFVDGNKRVATALLGSFLRVSGFDFSPDHVDLLNVILGVADGSLDYDDLVNWVNDVVC